MRIIYLIYYFIAYPIFKIFCPCSVRGRENIPDGPLIVCANHSALMDPILIALAFGPSKQLFFMAKAESFKTPIIGGIMKSAGVFPIRRGETDIAAIRTAMKHLKNGQQIMMFPEGTRVGQNDYIAAKSGAVRLATKTHSQILPIFLSRNNRTFRFSKMIIGKPYSIETPEDRDYACLSDELMKNIYALEPK